jgi:hypothetical protein
VGTLTVTESTVSGNATGDDGNGGGILNSDTLTLNNSTVSGNVGFFGGGILGEGSSTINNTTVSDNTGLFGGGVFMFGGGGNVTTLKNTIVAGNTLTSMDPDTGPDCFVSGPGSFTSHGFNLIGDLTACTFGPVASDITGMDPLLGPLQNNGGPTETHALLAGSPARDKGDPDNCKRVDGSAVTTDQRGATRPVDGDAVPGAVCDIGAYEAGACPTGFCHPNATCADTSGDFTCTCNPGFTGDGVLLRNHPARPLSPRLLRRLRRVGSRDKP